MEQAVKDDPAVKDAKHRMSEEKTRVLTEICMRDDAFRLASDEYRRAVNRAYIESKDA